MTEDDPAAPAANTKKRIEPNVIIHQLQAEADWCRAWAQSKSPDSAAYLNRRADVFERAADIVAWARDEAETRKRGRK